MTTSDKRSIPSAMQAWQFSSAQGGIEHNLKLNHNASIPKPSPTEHLVKVVAASLNPMDYKPAEIPIMHRLAYPKPATPGYDVVGRIIVPATNSTLEPGTLVFGLSSSGLTGGAVMAEFAAVPATFMIPVPPSLRTSQAASIPMAGLTAYQSTVPHIQPGMRVFINGGSGGTGTFGIQFAKAAGAHVTTSCSTKNVQLCQSLGADEVLDYTQSALLSQLQAIAKDGGRPFDLVVDNVCNDFDLYWKMHTFSSGSAKYLMVGWGPSLRIMRFVMSANLFPGFLGGGKRRMIMFMASNDVEDLEKIVDWVVQGKVKPVIAAKYSLEDVAEAYRCLKGGRVAGKLVLEVER